MARKITEISPFRTFLGGFLISVHSITAVSLAIMITEKSKEVRLMKQKYYLALTTEEWRLMIEPLNNLRNRLLSEGRYTDAVDKVLIKGSQSGHGGSGTIPTRPSKNGWSNKQRRQVYHLPPYAFYWGWKKPKS